MARRAGQSWSITIAAQAALIVLTILFAAPFVWLVSTSAKTPDELYPPKWIPPFPDAVDKSPYLALRQNETPVKPPLVSRDDWERLRTPIRNAITAKIVATRADLPAFFGPYLDRTEFADGIFFRLVKRAPDALFSGEETQASAWFPQNTTTALIIETFDAVYRRVALGEVSFQGWDLQVETPESARRWQVIDGDVEFVERIEGPLHSGSEVNYVLDEKNQFTVTTSVPIRMAPEKLKKIMVSIHGDKSWHEVNAEIRFNGRNWRSAQPGYLGSDQWQDFIWQFPSKDDTSIRFKNWLQLEDAGPSDTLRIRNETADEPVVHISIVVKKHNYLLTALHKFTENYRRVLNVAPVHLYLKNSVILVVLNTIGQIIGSSLVAFAFARLRWPGRDFYFLIVLATMMIPPQVTMIPVFLIFKWLGWYNTLTPLWIGSFFGTAFYIFLLRQFMMGIPRDLEDSAKIDGCSYFGIYWRIILPLIKPAIATVGIFTFVNVWNDFMGPLIYLSHQENYPLGLGIFALQVLQQQQPGANNVMMTACVLMTVPVVVLFFAAQRQFIQGITLTGMKG
jgi:multiple sugar transport system permease protein